MSVPASAKTLLIEDNHDKYFKFLANADTDLTLPVISRVPWVSASSRKDKYKKSSFPSDSNHKVHFISKNGHPQGFVWQTDKQKLKKAVRWGLIKPESVSGRVIAALGEYRIKAHERVAKGMLSNTQALKLSLLDIYQDRIEAIQDFESLVNRANTIADYRRVIRAYLLRLNSIQEEIKTKDFGSFSRLKDQLQKNIEVDKQRILSYLRKLETNPGLLRACNRARGRHSLHEFVKQQVLHNLYEFQGVNQDLSFSKERSFALTRGNLNDCIEDARKEIDDYRSDPRNEITAAHHGSFESKAAEGSLTYNFMSEHINSDRQRQALLAISFIEGWDSVDYSKNPPTISNGKQTEELSVIKATHWQTHRNLKTFLKSLGHYLANILKGTLLHTKPWEEEAWQTKDFHLNAKALRAKVASHEPMWLKPVNFLKHLGFAFIDIINGIRDFGANLVIKLPDSIISDWNSSKARPSSVEAVKAAQAEIDAIKAIEKQSLADIFKHTQGLNSELAPVNSELIHFDYHLTAGEQNDILTSMVRGVDGFLSVFTHSIFSKDPIGGLLFTSTYAIGGAVIFFPALSASILGTAYVNWFTQFSYAMGGSKLAAAIAGGSTQGQIFASAWDILMHGPSSITARALYNLAEDPITVGVYFGVAYSLGYLLANGIAGHDIPGLSEILREDLGTAPETGYPLIGGKIAIATYEVLEQPESHPYCPVSLKYNGKEIAETPSLTPEQKLTLNQFVFAHWLSTNASYFSKLSTTEVSDLARTIDSLFSLEEASALKKILYPEKSVSIAFQLVSIPLMYIPAILRLFPGALILSVIAKIAGHPYPLQPFKEAGQALADKTFRDLSRLLVMITDLIKLIFKCFASILKMMAYTVSMATGRLKALHSDSTVGASTHRDFASMHEFFRSIGEFLYPARATKKVISAHPAAVIKRTEESYEKLLEIIVTKIEKPEETPEPEASVARLYNSAKEKENVIKNVEIPRYP